MRFTHTVVAACALAACVSYRANFEPCIVQCTTDTGCPGDLTCGPEGLCRAAGAVTCVVPSDGTGGTITHVGGRTIHTFSVAQSGSMFMPPAVSDVEILIIAGGGGGGTQRGGGGGGAGGLLYATAYSVTEASYIAVVGAGGPPSINGESSSLGTLTAIGGGAGVIGATLNGGSGGGASHNSASGGVGAVGQGNGGGASGYDSHSMTFTGAGGGGAGGPGAVGTPGGGGAGGPGLPIAISGVQVYYAGGGGGGDQDLGSHGLSPGVGGAGGGGDGGLNAVGRDGVNGTGGGGGGGGGGPDPNFFSGGHGGAGIVIISYPTGNESRSD